MDLVGRSGNGSQTHGILQHWLFGSQSLVQTEACTPMGSRNCSGMGDSSSGSLEGLRCGSPLDTRGEAEVPGAACPETEQRRALFNAETDAETT